MDGTLSAYDPFYKFGQYKVAGLIPMAGVILILVTVLMVFMSTNTKFGRSIYAIGSNERAARLAGINVEWTQVAVYTITGLLCGISSGSNVAAALKLAHQLGPGKRVVTLLPDTAERYFSTPLFDEA